MFSTPSCIYLTDSRCQGTFIEKMLLTNIFAATWFTEKVTEDWWQIEARRRMFQLTCVFVRVLKTSLCFNAPNGFDSEKNVIHWPRIFSLKAGPHPHCEWSCAGSESYGSRLHLSTLMCRSVLSYTLRGCFIRRITSSARAYVGQRSQTSNPEPLQTHTVSVALHLLHMETVTMKHKLHTVCVVLAGGLFI